MSDVPEENSLNSSKRSLEEEEEEMVQPYKRFKVGTEGEDRRWQLPESLLEFIENNFEKYIPDKDLKESVMVPNPKPENMASVRKLDCYLQELMKDKKKSQELSLDATFEKFQDKINNIMGPLSRLWKAVDSVVTAVQEGSEDPPQLHVREALSLIEQTVVLVGQSHNAVQYERRKNVLGAILPNTQVSSTLKEKAEMLAKPDKSLFGKEFQDDVIETFKARKKSMEAFSIGSKGSSSSSNGRSRGGQFEQPFRQGPLQRKNQFRGQFNNNRKNYNSSKCLSLFKGKGTLSQISCTSSTNESRGFDSGSSNNKKNVLSFENSQGASSRAIKRVFTCLGNTDSRSDNFKHSVRFRNPFSVKSISSTNTISTKNGFKTKRFSRGGSTSNVVEGCHPGNKFIRRGVSKQHFSGPQKGWGSETCYKFESSESFCPLRAFQDGGVT